MYLSIFNNFWVIPIRCLNQCVSPKIAILPHLVSPGDAPGAITLNVVWMEREFDAYKLSRCMYLSNYNRFWDRARYWSKILAFDAPVRGGGSRQNIGIPFGTGKLEWCLYSFWRNSGTWRTDRHTDGRADGRTPGDGNSRACIASHGKNEKVIQNPDVDPDYY